MFKLSSGLSFFYVGIDVATNIVPQLAHFHLFPTLNRQSNNFFSVLSKWKKYYCIVMLSDRQYLC